MNWVVVGVTLQPGNPRGWNGSSIAPARASHASVSTTPMRMTSTPRRVMPIGSGTNEGPPGVGNSEPTGSASGGIGFDGIECGSWGGPGRDAVPRPNERSAHGARPASLPTNNASKPSFVTVSTERKKRKTKKGASHQNWRTWQLA